MPSTRLLVENHPTNNPLQGHSNRNSIHRGAFETPHGQRFQVNVTRKWFRFYWLVFVMIHAIDGVFLAAASKLYFWMLYQPTVMVILQTELHLLPISTLRSLVWIFPLLSVGHLLAVLEILVRSIQRRQLVLTKPDQRPQATNTVVSKREDQSAPVATQRREHLALLIERVRPFVTLEGKHFEIWFTIQEVFQIVSQTYQCYSMSRLVTTKWMNELAIVSAFLNCVSSPVIRLLVPSDIPRQRFFCVLVDCCMGFVQAVVIPFVIFYPYYQVYDTGNYYFPEKLVYNCVWYVEAIHNLDQVFIVSYMDFITTALPHLGFFRSLRGISRLLQTIDASGTTERTSVVAISSSCASVAPIGSTKKHSQCSTDQPQRQARVFTAASMYGALCLVFGFAVVAIHLAASNNNPTASLNCVSHPNPWFTKGFACSVISINCHRSRISGSKEEIQTILAQFDAPSTSVLVFSHCARLEMPPNFKEFEQVLGVDFYNSTLAKWNVDAEVHRGVHRVFNYVTMAQVNLSGIPEGIFGDNLPLTFTDVELYRTNLTSLPTDLGTKWPNMNALYLEFCELSELPTSLSEMPLWYFSAVGNHIKSIENDLFGNNTFSQLQLSNNPLQKFPASFGSLSDMSDLSFERTQVQEVPDVVMDWALKRLDKELYISHSVYGSPFCENAGVGSENGSELARYKAFACRKDLQSWKGYFPIEVIKVQLPL